MGIRRGLAAFCVLCAAAAFARADDWPQWRGPNRDAVSAEKGLLKAWPKEGPKLEWSIDTLGVGYSGPAVVGDRIYIAGSKDKDEVLFALNAKDGKEVWAKRIGPLYNNTYGGGPRATPSVDGDRVYALGGTGEIVCFDAAKGDELWRRNMTKDMAGVINPIIGGPGVWGGSWSTLVDGNVVVCVPGGKQGLLAALDRKTGNVVWQSKDVTDECTYSSPVVAEIGGVRQYVEMTNAGVVGVE